MADFPLASLQDSAKFGYVQEDVGIRSEMEGGYVLTRPRHTRRPRRTYKTGFTDLSDADKQTLSDFVDAHGTYLAFNYELPTTSTLVNVRFQKVPTYAYHGFGTNLRWDITDIILEEV
jgi:phage-related protein